MVNGLPAFHLIVETFTASHCRVGSETRRARSHPSRAVALITKDQVANLPARNQIPREISVCHQSFAMHALWERTPRGIRTLGFPGTVGAYIKTYNPRNYTGARASASRLMRHPHVNTAMQWVNTRSKGSPTSFIKQTTTNWITLVAI